MVRRSDLPRICVALGCAGADLLERRARQACEEGEEFLELRLDLLADPQQGVSALARLRRRYPDVVWIATCRRILNGGRFAGGVEEQLGLLEAAVEAGAQAVDIEVETAEAARGRLEGFRRRARLVISCHNFRSTPALRPMLRKLEATPADVLKLATLARKPTDNLRLLELARSYSGRPLVVVGMGEAGAPSRVLGLGRGSAFTYAAPSACRGGEPGMAPTAPGQISSRQMRRQYRVERHTQDTSVYGVIASPVGHSLSPAVHNRAFQACRIDAVYVPFRVEAGGVPDFLELAGKLPVAGFSVTIPHKQKVLRHLDVVDQAARRMGAVNTVYRRQGRLRGANTDAEAVTAPLARRLRLKGARILIAGNGGAARGAAFALLDKGAQVFLTGRHPGRVRALARLCGATPLDRRAIGEGRYDAVIQATPLGTYPHVDESFFTGPVPADLVFDLVYNPAETLLLRQSREAGKQVISGLEMFLEQAAAQFEIWTGRPAPRRAMEAAAREGLEAQAQADRCPPEGQEPRA